MWRSVRVAGALVIVATLSVACDNAADGDKAGSGTVVLKLATIDSVNNNGQSYGPQAFVDALGEVSGGRLKLEITNTFGEGAPDAESKLIQAIASGKVDAGWPSTRAFANAGISGLEAVEAPMTITNYDAQKALVSGDVAQDLLGKLEGSGVVGLGLAVGPLRRPFAARTALVEPADWNGERFRVYNSPVQGDAVEALGAEPVNLGFNWIGQAESGKLRGAEFDIAQYASGDYGDTAGNVTTNVVLWPKVFVLSFSEERWEALSDEQRGWVQEGADRASDASVEATYDETTPARSLCDQGVRFVSAAPDQLRDMRIAFQPVVDRLANDPASEGMLQAIQEIASEYPLPEPLEVSAGCGEGKAKDEAIGEVPTDSSSLPDGTYRVEITTDEVEAAGLNNADGNSGTWTMKVENGTFEFTCRPIDDPGIDCGGSTTSDVLADGELRGSGHTVYFLFEQDPDSPSRAEWQLDGDMLTFSDVVHGGTSYELNIEPWSKID